MEIRRSQHLNILLGNIKTVQMTRHNLLMKALIKNFKKLF